MGLLKLSCRVNTSISPMVFEPAKSTWSQSGKEFAVPSFHPPLPLLQPIPLRSPLIAAPGGYESPSLLQPLQNEEALAVAPLAAAATFRWPPAEIRLAPSI